jgi:hypothetical protein
MSLHFKFDLRLRVLSGGLGQGIMERWNNGFWENGKWNIDNIPLEDVVKSMHKKINSFKNQSG